MPEPWNPSAVLDAPRPAEKPRDPVIVAAKPPKPKPVKLGAIASRVIEALHRPISDFEATMAAVDALRKSHDPDAVGAQLAEARAAVKQGPADVASPSELAAAFEESPLTTGRVQELEERWARVTHQRRQIETSASTWRDQAIARVYGEATKVVHAEAVARLEPVATSLHEALDVLDALTEAELELQAHPAMPCSFGGAFDRFWTLRTRVRQCLYTVESELGRVPQAADVNSYVNGIREKRRKVAG